MLRKIKSFIRRRVQIDVGPTDIVLDVGSGDKPHWRADVLLERYLPEELSQHRSKGSSAVIDRWMVAGDLEDMPFRDKAFDYVVCSHVLEHVTHPGQAISELQRVAERGYIEVPFEGAQKLFDFPAHLWHIHSEDDKLTFTAKQSVAFDPYINHLMNAMIRAGIWQNFLNNYFDECIVMKYWKDQIPYEVQGELTEKFKQEVMMLSEQGLDWKRTSVLKRRGLALFSLLVRLAYRDKASRVKVDIASLLRCRKCGCVEFTSTDKGYGCCSCGELIVVLS